MLLPASRRRWVVAETLPVGIAAMVGALAVAALARIGIAQRITAPRYLRSLTHVSRMR